MINRATVSWLYKDSSVYPNAATTLTIIPTMILAMTLSPDPSALSIGFGGCTEGHGAALKHIGNVRVPWGSNIIEISKGDMDKYNYTMNITRSGLLEPWTVVFWNIVGPSGMPFSGFFGSSALTIMINKGEAKYVAFDIDTQGRLAAAPGSKISMDSLGRYTAT
jgi:hypothetical protein